MSSSHPSVGGNNSNNAPLVVDNGGGGGSNRTSAGAAAARNNSTNGGGGTPLRNNTTTNNNKPPSLASIRKLDVGIRNNIYHQIVRLLSQKRPHVIIGRSGPEKSQKGSLMREIYAALWHHENGTLRGYPYWKEGGKLAHKKLHPFLMTVVEYLAKQGNNGVPSDVHLAAAQIVEDRDDAVRSNAEGRQARADAEADLQRRNMNAQGAMGINATRGVTLPSNIMPGDVGLTHYQMNAAAGALAGRTGVASIGTGTTGLGLATNASANAGAAAAAARAGARSPFCE